jgi:hypothetical protein
MSSDGPPPIDGTDFSYWNVRMVEYLDDIDKWVLKAATKGFPDIVDLAAPTPVRKTMISGMPRLRTCYLVPYPMMCFTKFGVLKLQRKCGTS